MPYVYHRSYRGPIRAVIADLAGTLLDHGSRAPMGAFVELFERHGISITIEQARGPMGMHKRDHIKEITRLSEVSKAWQQRHGAACSEADIDEMYREFIPLQLEALPRYSAIISGASAFATHLHNQGVRFATTTGYNQEMMNIVLAAAASQGLKPEVAICASDVSHGRPAPWMLYRAMEQLDIYPPEAVVAIGDTLFDIEAGLNAGVWTIGLAKTGNLLGLSEEEIDTIPKSAWEARLAQARMEMTRAGAHCVVDGIYDALDAIEQINARLGSGEQP